MELASLMVAIGVDTSGIRAGLSSAVSQASQLGAQAGQAFASNFSSSVSRNLQLASVVSSQLNQSGGQLRATIYNMRELGRAAIAVTGTDVAAEYGRYRRQLQGISGDAKQAGDAFRTLRQIAADTNFDTGQVVSLGVKIAGRSGNVTSAARDVQDIVDAAASTGVQNENWNRFQTNLLQMRNFGNRRPSVVDARQMMNYAPLLSTQYARSMGLSTEEASERMGRMTGQQWYNAILGIGQQNRGAAARQSGSDVLAVGANARDDLRNALESTGRLVNTLLVPPLNTLRGVLQSLGNLNEATHGWFGLATVIGGGIFLVRQYGQGMTGALGATVRLTAAVNQYAAAANRGAAVGPGGALGPMAAGYSTYGRVGEFLRTYGPGALSLAAIYGGDLIKGDSDPRSARNLIGRMVSQGGAFGLVGSQFGPGGAAAGFGIGAAFTRYGDAYQQGGKGEAGRAALRDLMSFVPLGGLFAKNGIPGEDLVFGPKGGGGAGGASNSPAERAAKASEELVDLFKKIQSGTLIGGGDRARQGFMIGQHEAELFLLRSMKGNIG